MNKRAYTFRLYPTPEQEQNFARTFGCCRFVYNWALRLRTTSYFQQGIRLNYYRLSQALTALKKEEGTAWLKEVSSVPIQQALRHLETAFTNFFEKRSDYPTYKKKHGRQSATYASSAFTWNGTTLTLAKQQQPLTIVWSRPFPDGCTPSSVTVTKDTAGRYFVSILVEESIGTLPMADKNVGIDLGLKSLLITSDGETVANPKYYARDEKKLARAQRKHAKKQKGSKNRNKARKKVAKIHARLADTRRDFQQKLSTQIIRENQVMCLESLAVKNMLKNHKLAKAIADVGWSELVRQLEYKAVWYGRTVVRIDRFFPSSKTCSACQHVLEELTLAIREWICPNCAVCHDRDSNAAQNIKAEGLSVLACGGNVRPVRVKARRAIASEAGSSL